MLQITTQSAHAFQLSEFRAHVGIGYTDDDPALQRALDTAVTYWEHVTQFYTRNTTFTLDWYQMVASVPVGGGIVALSSVSRLAPDGTTTATVTSDWFLTRTLGEYVVRVTDTGDFRQNYRYTGTFAVAAAAVTPDVKAAVFALGNHFFMNRSTVEEVALYTVPFSVRAIVGMYQKGMM